MNARHVSLCWGLLFCFAIAWMAGCNEPVAENAEEKKEPIFNQKTQEIGEFDPENDASAANLQSDVTLNPASALRVYDHAVSSVITQQVDRMVVMFEIENDRYPRDHEEFMQAIIKRYNIQLPVLSKKRRYQYDLKNHKLIVVEARKQSKQ